MRHVSKITCSLTQGAVRKTIGILVCGQRYYEEERNSLLVYSLLCLFQTQKYALGCKYDFVLERVFQYDGTVYSLTRSTKTPHEDLQAFAV